MSKQELQAGLGHITSAPKDQGRIQQIVRRPEVDARERLDEATIDLVEGLVGDCWKERGSSRTPDGSANPEAQVTIMNSRVADLVAGDESRWQLAGDQIYADYDISIDNLPPGTRLRLGTAIVEVSAHPHTGCEKFVGRFGRDAMRFVNSPDGRELRLRGMNTKVVVPGIVRVGDVIEKHGPDRNGDRLDELPRVIEDLKRDGYAIVEDLLSPAEVEAARKDVAKALETTPYGRNDFEGHETRRVYALFAKTRAFDAAAVHPLLLGVLDKFLREYHLSAPVAIAIGPGNPAQALHPDDGTYPIPRPHVELVVNMMLPLVDFHADNGATRLVPGSHRWTDRQPAPDEPTVSPELTAGNAMFFLGSLWHGGGANNTDTDRLGVILHYSAAWLRPVENHVLAVPQSVVRGLEPRLQELLGYNIATPFVGYVDGRHPKKVLEETGAGR